MTHFQNSVRHALLLPMVGFYALTAALPAGAVEVASSPYASLPLVRDDGASTMSSARIAIGMLLLLALVAWFVRRRFAAKPTSLNGMFGMRMPRAGGSEAAPRVQSVTRLNGNVSLHVVEWQGHTLLLSCAGETVTVLERVRKDAMPGNDSTGARSE
ncbi:flagellar biosynthetic protein FliO [Pandoraea pneumonica]|uniref:flagellar biosynthetic protein FliO n=1 Tax=Pandoraea pneumonica TaxID=2508299 RepID=UPI003CFAC503